MGNVSSWLIFALIIVGLAVYMAWDKRNKVHCTFHRPDKTVWTGWIKKDGKWIIFDGGLYVLSPERMSSEKYNPLGIVPTEIQHADFIYFSSFAWNPETFMYTDVTPNSWNALNKEKEMQDYDRGNQSGLNVGGKQGMLEKYLPIIVLAGFAILGYFMYTTMKNVNSVGRVENIILNQIATK